MIGRGTRAVISRTTSSENAPPTAVTPIKMVGDTDRTTSARDDLSFRLTPCTPGPPSRVAGTPLAWSRVKNTCSGASESRSRSGPSSPSLSHTHTRCRASFASAPS